jgi:N1-aminopropylagmatine ureohydrolase
MRPYPTKPPTNFLGLPPEASSFASSAVLILPVPYEVTTSYGGGTRSGPTALIEASAQVELYDPEFDDEPALRWGIHTLPPLAPDLASPEAAVAQIAAVVEDLAKTGRLLVVLGGEHTVSVGVARGLNAAGAAFTTVQLDAHADLRDTYDGTPYSHACAARRISELGPVVQVGVRSLDVSEARFIRESPDRVTTFTAERVRNDPGYLDALAEAVRGRRVFLTIDLDVLDPSIMPATGTPEPGGLSWFETLAAIRTVVQHAEVAAFDCVELAPVPGLRAPDFTAARLVYKTISLVLHAVPEAEFANTTLRLPSS